MFAWLESNFRGSADEFLHPLADSLLRSASTADILIEGGLYVWPGIMAELR